MKSVNRRSFIGGVAAALGYAGLSPFELAAQRRGGAAQAAADPTKPKLTPDEALAKAALDYDKMAKLANNENPYGPSEAVLKAMNDAWKYANRYGYPDPGIRDAIAEHHGVKPENILISAGSSEILKAVDDTYVPDHRKIVGADPTYASVYQYATNSRGQAVRVALKKDYNQDIDAMIHATKLHARDVGLVYICNPNNPTGRIVPKEDIKKLFDNTPEEIPVLIDEAYHHFVDNPAYETSIKYVLEGRRVIVARTFSKIAALAGMRLGFAIAPKDMVAEMQQTMVGSGYTVNAIVRFGGVAALKDTVHEAKMKSMNKQVRDSTLASLKTMGWEVIPSDSNFFMVNVHKDVAPVAEDFKKKNILVGRKFPPMDEWLRVSVGSDDEMKRFLVAFKEIFPEPPKPTATTAAAAAAGR